MRIADICTRDVVQIGPDAPLQEAAETMRKRHVGALVVTEQPNGEQVPVGIITDRDIVLAVVAPAVTPEALTTADVMTRDLATCSEDEELFDAIQTMRKRGVRRLPVLNARGGLAGIVAADDIFTALGTHMRDLSQVLGHEQARETHLRD